MRSRQIPALLMVVLLAITPAAMAEVDEKTTPKQVMGLFLKAFGEANTTGMGAFYASEVIVLRGSTLLDKRYGGLGGDDGTTKDQKVSQERLLKAYDKAIEVFGGKDDWTQKNTKLKDEEITFVTVTAEQAEKVKEMGVKADDVIALVIPKGDTMTFVLRKSEKGTWIIVAEHWN